MANWVHQGPWPQAVSWGSRDAADTDPGTFWTYVATALAKQILDITESVLPCWAPRGAAQPP